MLLVFYLGIKKKTQLCVEWCIKEKMVSINAVTDSQEKLSDSIYKITSHVSYVCPHLNNWMKKPMDLDTYVL